MHIDVHCAGGVQTCMQYILRSELQSVEAEINKMEKHLNVLQLLCKSTPSVGVNYPNQVHTVWLSIYLYSQRLHQT